MKTSVRLLSILAMASAIAAPALAQSPNVPGGASAAWREVERKLGLQSTYSVDMSMSAMGMNMDAKVFRDGDKSRTEMLMPMLNVKMAMLELVQNGKPVSYSLFPEKKKFMANDDAVGDAGSFSAPQIDDLGTEAVDGVACSKRRVVMNQAGVRSEMTVWLSPKLKNMPVKMVASADVPMQPGQPSMPMQTTILFKNYDFSAPSPALFSIPADYAKINDMMEILMDGGSEGFGALLQQMQQQMGE